MVFPAELRFLPGAFIHALLSRVTLASAGISCSIESGLDRPPSTYLRTLETLRGQQSSYVMTECRRPRVMKGT